MLKKILIRIIEILKDNRGMSEIIGSAFLMLFVTMAVMPSITGCSITADKLIKTIDDRMKEQMGVQLN
ncbi:hypothetical protein ACAG39_01935 [Caldicellulosiruptoraceae bacterium PP1]